MKWIKKMFCKIGWHKIDKNSRHNHPHDPLKFLVFAKCKWCGYEGQVDSQGNLF